MHHSNCVSIIEQIEGAHSVTDQWSQWDTGSGDVCVLWLFAATEQKCTNNICQHGGTCHDVTIGFICSCVDGYTGSVCQTGSCVTHTLVHGISLRNQNTCFENNETSLREATFWWCGFGCRYWRLREGRLLVWRFVRRWRELVYLHLRCWLHRHQLRNRCVWQRMRWSWVVLRFAGG